MTVVQSCYEETLTSKRCNIKVGNLLGSQSAWLSPAAPPSTSSPSLLSSGPLTHRHYNTQREGASDDMATIRFGMKKSTYMPGNQTLKAVGDEYKGFFMSTSKQTL